MDLFTINYEEHCPDTTADTPHKKGIARLLEIISRDFWSFYASGWLALLSALPYLASSVWGVWVGNVLVSAIGGIIGGALAAPLFCCCMDTIFRSLRDEPGFWWYTYKRIFKENALRAAVLGGGFGCLEAIQVFALCRLMAKGQTALIAVQLLGLFLCGMMTFFSLVQTVLVTCSIKQLLKNDLLLTIGFLPHALLIAGIWSIYSLLLTRTAGLTMLLITLCNVWGPIFISCFAIYKPLDSCFHIEDSAKRKAA